MRTFNLTVIGLALAFGLACIYASSIPGSATGLGFGLIIAFGPLVLAYLVLAALSWAYSKRMTGLWLVPLICFLALLIAKAGVAEQVHWQFIRSDLESAVAGGECPKWAGATRVYRCAEVAGGKAFDLDGGFLDAVYLVKDAHDFSPNQRGYLIRELDNGWSVVGVNF